MTYIKLNEQNQTIEYPPINKDNICNYNMDTESLIADGYVDVEQNLIDLFNQEKGKVQNNTIVDISQTPEYLLSQLKLKSEQVYKNIVQKYDEALNYGIFQIEENINLYANMAWDKTWTNVLSVYSNMNTEQTHPTEFNVRLYEKIDNKYYSKNTVQTISTLNTLLSTLKSKQFFHYQPIRDNLLTQLSIYANAGQIDKIIELENTLGTAFGDIIDETQTLVPYGA